MNYGRWICAGLLAALVVVQVRAKGPSADAAFEQLQSRYVREFLRRNPVVSTYLGGSGLDASLAAADGTLRDWSPEALKQEARVLREIESAAQRLDAAALSSVHRVDRAVLLHQIAFQLHQNQERKYWQRSLDTYVNEAFRGIDWFTQGMTALGEGRYGSETEWRRVAERVGALPRYLERARANLEAGLRASNTPDWRMVERDGLASSEANAVYFEKTLSELAAERTRGQPFGAALLADLKTRGAAAARSFRELKRFLEGSLARQPRVDRYALGAAEYDWALKNNLNVNETAAGLYESSWPVVEKTREQLMATAQTVAEASHLGLAWDAGLREASTRTVFDVLSKEAPRSDEEMVRWYHDTALRLVDYARKNQMFEIPDDYRLDVTVTPPTLEASIDGAAYYPAPPFRNAGVGRFYISPTKGDLEKLKQNNRASIADLSAHEGFPGHDWHYKVMTRYREQISPLRWLTPGEVEGSASMWEDSMAAEGWALYSEALMAEPAPHAAQGFYTPEERLYQLRGQLYRDLRVRVDTGLHTGRLSFDDAVDLFSEIVTFLPGSCRGKDLSPEKKASCDSATRAIFRYSKWPTQAITYRLGKDRILALRARAEALVPAPAGRQRFHVLFMQQGTIPPGYFEDELLAGMTR
jgi:uncharacterized protein (DUF885 family)